MKNICLLGSTGSIGTQTLDIVRENPDRFNIVSMACNSNIDLMKEQIMEFKPQVVCVYNEGAAKALKNKLDCNTKVLTGIEGLIDIVEVGEIDVVLTAMVGNIGLLPTVKAIEAGKDIALANKETLVTAGEIIMGLVKEKGVNLYPVDSEHSAIFQSLQGSKHKEIEKIILTASGGPFRGKNKEELINIKKAEALKHPNWSMGSKITIDSSTMMNKGLEVIEAKWLFDVKSSDIDVLVHPQSIVHSMIQFRDSSVIAQLGVPDMRLPILYALDYPERNFSNLPRLDLAKVATLTFEKADNEVFPCLNLAYDVLNMGKTYPVVLNAANEVLVDLFLKDEIAFYDIPKYIEMAMEKHRPIGNPNVEEILNVDKVERIKVLEYIK